MARVGSSNQLQARFRSNFKRMTNGKISPPGNDIIASVAQEHDMQFLAFEGKSYLVKYIHRMSNHVTGTTSKIFVPSVITAIDVMLGPIKIESVTEVDHNGQALNVASNVSGAKMANLAPCAAIPTARAALAAC